MNGEYKIKNVGGDKGGMPASGDLAKAKSIANLSSSPAPDAAVTKIKGNWNDHPTAHHE